MSDDRLKTLPEGPILVVAPHPDDETLGCGGLIAAACRDNQRVHIVFVTEGGASHPNSIEWPREKLAEQREAEASEALERLGAGHQPRSFLRLKDAAMPAAGTPSYRRALCALVAILHGLRPKLVVLPWRRDPHCDHRDSWQLTIDALAGAGLTPEIYEYAIWLDKFGQPADRPSVGEIEELRLDVSGDLAAKRHALQAHRSQLGQLVTDDPSGFVLDEPTIARLTGAEEVFWRSCRAL
ncbi:MAG: PIG-L family deacetylase [Mesorhizobium sp.]|nr:PIG-L family deacetylase [Mesorhizobium sp.]